MTSFAETALKPDGETVPEGELTVDVTVHKVYREGRNKLAHGEMSGLLEDLAEPRAIGELDFCHDDSSERPGSQEPSRGQQRGSRGKFQKALAYDELA